MTAPGEYGLTPRRVRDDAIIRRYQDGETLRRIGRSLDLTHERIRQILNDAGIPIRGRGYRSPNPVPSRAATGPLSRGVVEPAGTDELAPVVVPAGNGGRG